MERTPPKVQVVRGGRHGLNRARQLAASTLNVLAVALLLGLIVSVVYSQAKITELNGEINEAKTQLTAAQSEYDYLATQMSNITSRTSLQQVAEGQLGACPGGSQSDHLCAIGGSERHPEDHQQRRAAAVRCAHRSAQPAGQPEPVTEVLMWQRAFLPTAARRA